MVHVIIKRATDNPITSHKFMNLLEDLVRDPFINGHSNIDFNMIEGVDSEVTIEVKRAKVRSVEKTINAYINANFRSGEVVVSTE